jgi:hypothetical protein
MRFFFFCCYPQITFRAQDVQVPDIPGMFTTFKARNVPLFVDGEQFESNYHHYGKIMGYDKPLSLRYVHRHFELISQAQSNLFQMSCLLLLRLDSIRC